jgi:hypothetical protein
MVVFFHAAVGYSLVRSKTSTFFALKKSISRA